MPLALIVLLLIIYFSSPGCREIGAVDHEQLLMNVSYDHRAIVIDGVRRVLISGCVHYPRSTPEVQINSNVYR
jgi:hypothetical protein